MESKRIQWIDLAKGITIILVLVGHTIYKPIIRGPIFSFHMPLFFILSAYTFKLASDKSQLKKNIKKYANTLIIPAVIAHFIYRVLMYEIYSGSPLNFKLFLKYQLDGIVSLLWSNGFMFDIGNPIHNGSFREHGTIWNMLDIGNFHVDSFGVLWFLIVLFTAKTLYDSMQLFLGLKKCGLLCLVMSLVGVMLGIFKMWLPFSFDITLAVMIFIHFGVIMRGIDLESKKKYLIFCVILYVIGFFSQYCSDYRYLEIAVRKYYIFPITYIVAICGSLILMYICIIICSNDKLKKICNPLCILGRYSMYLYLIHACDLLYINYLETIIASECLLTLIKISIDVTIWYVFYKYKTTIKAK